MSKVLVDELYLKDTGDALREVTNTENKIHTSQFGPKIRQLKTFDEDTNIPQYVRSEAVRVAAIASRVITEKSLVLGCISDIHYGYFNNAFSDERCSEAIEHTGQALNLIKKMIGLDACLMLGDTIDGGKTLTPEIAKSQFDKINSYINKAFSNVPNFRLNGNHDNLRYKAADSNLSADDLFDKIGKFNTSDVEKTNRNYGYHDFEDKKIRLIYLNTCDSGDIDIIESSSGFTNFAFSVDQLSDFVDYLDLSEKDNPSDWKIITIGHHPLDFGSAVGYTSTYTDASDNTFDLYGLHILTIIKAYMQGTAGSIIHNGQTVSYNFNNIIQGHYLGHLHGHVHNFSSGKIKIGSEYLDARRITIPNVHPFRQNDSGGSYAEFHEDISYPKTAGCENETAFNIVVINPNEEKIYCFNYGSGYDRTVYYGFNPIAVTSLSFENENYMSTVGESLTIQVNIEPANATDNIIKWSSSDEAIAEVKTGSLPQEVIITPKKSGSATITATAHNGITASFSLIISPKQIKNVFNPAPDYGAKNDTRIKWSNGTEETGTTGARGYCSSAFIPWDGTISHNIYIKNSLSQYRDSGTDNALIAVYDSTKTNLITKQYLSSSVSNAVIESGINREDGVIVLSIKPGGSNWAYIRVCVLGDKDTVVLTIDADPNDESNTISLDSVINDVQEYARLESAVENIAETYLDYEDDPEIEINPEWEAQIGTINGFFSDLKQNLEETYIGGE